MARLKWFLVGFLVCLFLANDITVRTEELRLRAESAHLRDETARALDAVEFESAIANAYEAQWSKLREVQERMNAKAADHLVAQVEALKMVVNARPNDKALVSLLAEAEKSLHDDAAPGEGEVVLRQGASHQRHP